MALLLHQPHQPVPLGILMRITAIPTECEVSSAPDRTSLNQQQLTET